jgi:hypothetical protein
LPHSWRYIYRRRPRALLELRAELSLLPRHLPQGPVPPAGGTDPLGSVPPSGHIPQEPVPPALGATLPAGHLPLGQGRLPLPPLPPWSVPPAGHPTPGGKDACPCRLPWRAVPPTRAACPGGQCRRPVPPALEGSAAGQVGQGQEAVPPAMGARAGGSTSCQGGNGRRQFRRPGGQGQEAVPPARGARAGGSTACQGGKVACPCHRPRGHGRLPWGQCRRPGPPASTSAHIGSALPSGTSAPMVSTAGRRRPGDQHCLQAAAQGISTACRPPPPRGSALPAGRRRPGDQHCLQAAAAPQVQGRRPREKGRRPCGKAAGQYLRSGVKADVTVARPTAWGSSTAGPVARPTAWLAVPPAGQYHRAGKADGPCRHQMGAPTL